jgi:hypothetical protein
MATPEQFNRNMGRLGTRVTRNADQLVRKVVMAVDQTVVMATPVDTGRARANWIASLNAPSETTTASRDRSGGSAISQAAGVVARYDGDSDTEVNITNNLDYIGRLNDGSSAQAPADFVGEAVAKGAAAVAGARLLDEGGAA